MLQTEKDFGLASVQDDGMKLARCSVMIGVWYKLSLHVRIVGE
jgi:hypothetical protein